MATQNGDKEEAEAYEQSLKSQFEAELEAKLEEEFKKTPVEDESNKFFSKDIDEQIRSISAADDHEDRIQDRALRKDWATKILVGLFGYGILNYLLIVAYGLGFLNFTDTDVIKIFLGGNVAAIPLIAIYITKSLFPQKSGK